MYESYWGLNRAPFPSGIDARLFYEDSGSREALARLRFLVGNRRQMGLVLGDQGLGKSLLLEVFARQCRRRNHHVVQVDLQGINTREFYWQLATQLGTAPQLDEEPLRLFRRVADRLAANRYQRQSTIVLLDDVDEAGPDVLAQIIRLARTERAKDTRLTIVMGVDRRHIEHISGQLPELVDLRIDLCAWDEADTLGYVQLALVEAGCERPLFDEDALRTIHGLSDGVPRRVNRLADYALLAGSGTGQQTIDATTVAAANDAVSWPVPVS